MMLVAVGKTGSMGKGYTTKDRAPKYRIAKGSK
jgi:hypothetical protein